jgi:tetratricopeptide (TPR) repeat protein
MTAREHLDRYEANGDEADYARAFELYQSALAERPDDPLLLRDFGYLQECHGLRAIGAAIESYERALARDPENEKTRLQLLHAQASLGHHDDAIARCRELLAEHAEDPAAHRCLAYAYVAARDFARAGQAIEAGLAIAPEHAGLIELQGDVLAALGRPEEALDRWRQAHAHDPENLSPRYSAVFLLQREGRLEEAAEEWRAIIAWCEARGYELDLEWPRRELARLESQA